MRLIELVGAVDKPNEPLHILKIRAIELIDKVLEPNNSPL
jgi:hypothetical protein